MKRDQINRLLSIYYYLINHSDRVFFSGWEVNGKHFIFEYFIIKDLQKKKGYNNHVKILDYTGIRCLHCQICGCVVVFARLAVWLCEALKGQLRC